MKVIDTYCDPTMFVGSKATDTTSIGDIFQQNGVMITPSVNDRVAAGFAIHEYLNTTLSDGLPKLQIYEPGCPMLCRTLPEMRVDRTNPRRIADGPDHWVIALAYFCLATTYASQPAAYTEIPRWMRRKADTRHVLGSESVRHPR